MNIGTFSEYEIWFIPRNHDNYSSRCLQSYSSLVDAEEYARQAVAEMHGDVVIVRAKSERKIVQSQSTQRNTEVEA